ncbi:nucleoside hydrolase [Lewinella sp. JB7]|uniref:nucleoside hydrolase n=1 Tax=Lewinella sp. JB7 TaxID=2962887 RepID=UPI0020C97ABA|nr:nucleoside hydrolase [Lewinella sp. JB7]MCP9237414.1 nucleoside hydrolase [Lewinella sp. JB7]
MRVLPLLLLLLAACKPPAVAQSNTPVRFILDADTANEIDDLYAIAYLFGEKRVDWLGLSSAQWFHHYSGDSTVYQSQVLNEELLALAGRTDLPHPLGADSIMGMPWGGYEARNSPAAQFIIEQARGGGAGAEKLVVMCIGASTNLASAIALAPDIKERIKAYVLGFQYNAEGGFWNKDEFNIRRDLNAANYLLNAEGLELHVMPTSTAIQYQWDRDSTFARLDRSGAVGAHLKRRWETFSDARRWTMWDVAALQALLKPEQATEIEVMTPPENTQRRVWVYTDIDEAAMARDFWQRLQSE